MTGHARVACKQAVYNIHLGNYSMAIACLRDALKQTSDRRAWSKLMLAIRELNRVIN